MEKLRIILVDDSPLFRKGLSDLLASSPDMEVVDEAGDGFVAVEKARILLPDLMLMDIYMPRCNGLEATRLIKEEMPSIKIVMLTVSEDEQHLFETVKAGAEGYVLKNVEPGGLLQMLRGLSRGEAAISPSMAKKILDEFAQPRHVRESSKPSAASERLTEREKEVLLLLMEGHSNKEIASLLGISESTTKNRLRNIMDKLHVYNRIQAAIRAIQREEVSPPWGAD